MRGVGRESLAGMLQPPAQSPAETHCPVNTPAGSSAAGTPWLCHFSPLRKVVAAGPQSLLRLDLSGRFGCLDEQSGWKALQRWLCLSQTQDAAVLCTRACQLHLKCLPGLGRSHVWRCYRLQPSLSGCLQWEPFVSKP